MVSTSNDQSLTQVSLVRALVDKLRPTCVLTTTIGSFGTAHRSEGLAFDVQPALVQPVIDGFEWHLRICAITSKLTAVRE